MKSEDFFPSLITACAELQAYPKVVNTNEDSRNAFIHTQLKAAGFNSKDQGRQGISSTGKGPGELDIKIEDHRGVSAIIECFDLSSKETAKIELHIKKLFGYEPNGLDRNFVIVYSEAKGFVRLWKEYQEYIPHIKCGSLSLNSRILARHHQGFQVSRSVQQDIQGTANPRR